MSIHPVAKVSELQSRAFELLASGLCVLPAYATRKFPALSEWKQYQSRLPSPDEAAALLQSPEAICIVAGEVSGNLELLDFDVAAEKFEPWAQIVRERLPSVLEKCFIERSQSGGKHVVYRCQEPVDGSMKLAMRVIKCESDAEQVIAGKKYKPRKAKSEFGYEIELALIETKGEGGLFLCAPSPGYIAEQGDLTRLPVLSPEEHAAFISVAIELNEKPLVAGDVAPAWTHPQREGEHQEISIVRSPQTEGSLRPGDDFNQRGDVREVLKKHGWTLCQSGENEHWTRPGKPAGTSATLKGSVFYVFTTNGQPFEPDKGYSIFAVYAMLEHNGDFAAAARQLARDGYGERSFVPAHAEIAANGSRSVGRPIAPLSVVGEDETKTSQEQFTDPGPFPDHLLDVPGFIGEVMQYNKATAHRWQPVLALGGAIVLQAALAARKVADERGNRTNIYVINLAGSGGGKENARAVNKKILLESGCDMLEGPEDIASDAGLVNLVAANPAIMLQIDEIGRWLRTLSDPKRAPHQYAIVSTLLRFYSNAGTMFRGKAYSDSNRNVTIEQPCVSLLGTTVPENFHCALTPVSVTEGFLPRMLVFEAVELPPRVRTRSQSVPESIVNRVKWWKAWQPEAWSTAFVPKPVTVESTTTARQVFDDFANIAETYIGSKHKEASAVWSRAEENACRLALIYACSRDPDKLVIDEPAAVWACNLSKYMTRYMLWIVQENVAYNEFDARQQLVLRRARGLGGTITQSEVCRITQHLNRREREEIIDNLVHTGRLKESKISTKGRAKRVFEVVK